MGEALELFRFIALSSSVHADALQCLVDDTQEALSQMTLDVERLDDLEMSLSTLLKEQQHLHAMRDVVRRSKTAREEDKFFMSSANQSKSRPKAGIQNSKSKSQLSALSNIEGVLRFASSALDREDLGVSLKEQRKRENTKKIYAEKKEDEDFLQKNAEEGENTEVLQGEINVDEAVEKVKSEIRLLETMSIKSKLRELETLKQQIRDVDGNAIMKRYVESFRFPTEVEQLWRNEDFVINGSNVDLFIARACGRLVGRYEDSLSVIDKVGSGGVLSRDRGLYRDRDNYRDGEEDEDFGRQVLGALLYATALTGPNNPDAAAVVALQYLQFFHSVDSLHALLQCPVVGLLREGRGVETVLAETEYGVLPTEWRATGVLCTPEDMHLPSARHILTPRFSFSDAEELKALQTLRVDFQRELLDAFIRMPKVLDEVRQQALVLSQENESSEEDMGRDTCVALVRLLTGKESGGSVWTTVARCGTME
ncbi:uncharacterized protein TM35_000014790 [Trypanosoma theileri]|uniref:Uncharacterized protein n=1 Tax=Trypanosoma theileri TaxID=67003 RepID=A0A1X0P9K0_9TRYP|nr:uncharacterized protein TM35_000014790 [Trypanosoma theileri]ORC93602.1 hypothetical protein TM35_000014790 [Trypanosoma theileri]